MAADGLQPADSAGRPWAGRSFEANSWSGDDGTAPTGYADALAALHAGSGSAAAVVDALRGARLLMPLIASLAESAVGDHGITVDKSAELALPTVAGPDGRAVLPAFSSMAAMQRWNPDARPIPAPARQVALGAAADGTELVIIDAGDERPFVLRRPAVEALARDVPWTPSWQDPEVRAAMSAAAFAEPDVDAADVDAGDPFCTLAAAEVRVTLALRPGLGGDALAALLARIQSRWADDAVIASRVDSLSLRIRTAS